MGNKYCYVITNILLWMTNKYCQVIAAAIGLVHKGLDTGDEAGISQSTPSRI